MRAASRLLANATAGAEKYLEAGAPTGLTGLLTHPTPRSTLLYLYSSTLDKLQKFPESSVYRQSLEALTKHRLQIIAAAKPENYDAWQKYTQELIKLKPAAFEYIETSQGTRVRLSSTKKIVDFRLRQAEWDGESAPFFKEGPRFHSERKVAYGRMAGGEKYDPLRDVHDVTIKPEPPLTAQQISEVENQIGAGLIEEVIQVAEGELKLVDVMAEAQIWDELSEKAPEGQWVYHERGLTHTKTQSP